MNMRGYVCVQAGHCSHRSSCTVLRTAVTSFCFARSCIRYDTAPMGAALQNGRGMAQPRRRPTPPLCAFGSKAPVDRPGANNWQLVRAAPNRSKHGLLSSDEPSHRSRGEHCAGHRSLGVLEEEECGSKLATFLRISGNTSNRQRSCQCTWGPGWAQKRSERVAWAHAQKEHLMAVGHSNGMEALRHFLMCHEHPTPSSKSTLRGHRHDFAFNTC